MSEIKKGHPTPKQEALFNKTMGTPGSFTSAFASPMRPSTQGVGSLLSPKKMSSYRIHNLDPNNEVAKKLKDKLESFMSQKREAHQTQDVLYGCLSEMLGSVSLTKDKRLQDLQLQQVDKWFDENCNAVEYRTKVPSYLSSSTRVSTTTQNTPRGKTAKSQGSSFRFINKTDSKVDSAFNRTGFSFVNQMNMSQSAFMTPQSKVGKMNENQDTSSTEKLFMNKRIGFGPYVHYDPTKISNFDYGTPSHKRDLDTALTKSMRSNFTDRKVDMSVTSNVLKWSMFKRDMIAKSSFKKEMLKDSSQFQNVGIPARGSLLSNFTGINPPKTAADQTRQYDVKIEDFLNDTQESLESNDSLLDLKRPHEKLPVPRTPIKTLGKATKIIDLTQDESLYDFQIKEPDPNAKPKPPKPINPYGLSQVEKKTSYTSNQLREVHMKRIHQIRKYRATHLFFETPAERDEAEREAMAQSNTFKEPVERKYNYPCIGDDKQNLNSIMNDQEQGSQHDVISLSCFSRPLTRTAPKPQSTKANGLSHEALSKMGYNFKLIPKQKEDRLHELREIESISRELAKNEIYIPNKTLQKAIIYDNEREITKKLKAPQVFSDPANPPEVIEEEDEFEVKYPKPDTLLLENPFAEKKKASKKKKKK